MSTLYHIILPTDFRNSQKIPCISWDTQRWQTTRGKSFAASGDIRWRHHLRQRKNSNENGGFKTSKRSETVKSTMNSNYTTENQPTIKPESSEKRLHWPSFIIGNSKKRLYTPRKLTAGTHTPCAPSPTLVNPTPLRHDLKHQVKFNVLLHPRNTREGLSRNWFRGIPLKSAWNTPPIGHMHTKGWLSKCWFLDWALIPHFHWGPLHKYLVGLPYLHFSKI